MLRDGVHIRNAMESEDNHLLKSMKGYVREGLFKTASTLVSIAFSSIMFRQALPIVFFKRLFTSPISLS